MSAPSPGRSAHSHPCLSQACSCFLHSKGCRNLLFHSWLKPPLQLHLSLHSSLLQAWRLCFPLPHLTPPPISPFFSPIFSSLYIILESQREKELRVTSRIQDLESTHLGSCPSFSSCYLCDFGQMTKFPNPSNSSVRGAKPGNHCFLPTYALNT